MEIFLFRRKLGVEIMSTITLVVYSDLTPLVLWNSINLLSIESLRYDLMLKELKKNFAIRDSKKQRVGFILPIEPLPGLGPYLLLFFLFPHSPRNWPQYPCGT